jgi:hypothetical protein
MRWCRTSHVLLRLIVLLRANDQPLAVSTSLYSQLTASNSQLLSGYRSTLIGPLSYRSFLIC